MIGQIDKALSAEAEEKKVANIIGHGKIRRGLFYQEGEAALNEMFQKIYADAITNINGSTSS